MDETPLRDLLRRLGDTQQPPATVNLALARAAGRSRLRRRRAGITVTAAAVVAFPAVIGITLGQGPAAPRPGGSGTTHGPANHVTSGPPAQAGRGSIAYVTSVRRSTVVPINTATNKAGKPIKVVSGVGPISATPNGKTVYIANEAPHGAVTPISTASKTAGKPIRVGAVPSWLTITPNGRILYVANTDSDTVTAISTATDTVIKTIKVGHRPTAIAVAPDSKTAYVGSQGSDTVSVISATTNTVIKTINHVGEIPHDGPIAMAITPNGATLYTANLGPADGSVTAISTATDTVVKTITGCPEPGVIRDAPVIAVTPDSKTAYVICNKPPRDTGIVLPISTATNTPGKPIKLGPFAQTIAITPDGQTAYAVNYHGTVLPISTATNVPGKPIKIGDGATAIAMTPNGKTAYVLDLSAGLITPISTATNTAGKPIRVRFPLSMAIVPKEPRKS